eukprot:GFYU01000317.1.p1 GENE.GFYU01000317.1~~GFYU01000317.1.p1  ORF type:complete len:102 (+),score=28.81 GFYU01000317.1:203-508(+)
MATAVHSSKGPVTKAAAQYKEALKNKKEGTQVRVHLDLDWDTLMRMYPKLKNMGENDRHDYLLEKLRTLVNTEADMFTECIIQRRKEHDKRIEEQNKANLI